ncbi:MAG: TM0106 family RecB-like putative nuclease [Patescibacteria group bacterium]
MSKRLSEKTFYHYLKCPSWVYFDAHQAEKTHDALLTRLIDDGLLPEMQRELLADRQFVEVENEDPDDAFLRTLELMKAGEQTILRGVLIRGHWIGHPDILERVEGNSGLGNYYYIACDIKRDRHIQDVYKFQGAFYAELLGLIQATKPTQGYVMSPEGGVQSYFLDEFESEFKLTLEEIEKILAGVKPPHFLTSGCKQSPWFETCRGENVECDDLSIINRVWRSEVEALNRAGVKSVGQLAAADADLLASKISTVARDRLHHLRMQAISLHEGRTIVMESVPFPPADVELYFDVESSPVRDVEFLFGVLVVDHQQEMYHSFVAKKPSEERQAFEGFLQFMKDYPAAPVYHFGWYEIEVLRRLGEKYDCVPTVEAIIKDQMHDLLIMIRDAIIFPLHFYSLKDIAKAMGFKWRGAEASGINAVIWYEEYLANPRRTKKLQAIIDYNEDDCRATYIVKKWVAEKAGE